MQNSINNDSSVRLSGFDFRKERRTKMRMRNPRCELTIPSKIDLADVDRELIFNHVIIHRLHWISQQILGDK
jgi:hypothetical protein